MNTDSMHACCFVIKPNSIILDGSVVDLENGLYDYCRVSMITQVPVMLTGF